MTRFAILIGFSLVATTVTADQHAELFKRLDKNGDGQVEASEVSPEHARLFERLVRKADESGDGRLSGKEFAAGLKPSVAPKPIYQQSERTRPGASDLRLLLLRLDTDRDAFLTRDEAPKELKDAYDQLAGACDQNKDGEIAFRELTQTARQAMRAATRIVRREGWDVKQELPKVEAQQGKAAGRFDRRPDPRAVFSNPKRLASVFKALDYDNNGRLTVAELPEQARGEVERLLRRADRDRSGDVTMREFSSASQQLGRLLRLTNRLGLSRPTDARDKQPTTKPDEPTMMADEAMAESSKEGVGARLVRRMVKRMDKDSDGAITKQEASGQLARRFDRIDTNSDGRLDAAEMREEAKRLQKRLDRADSKTKKKNKNL